MTSSALTLPAKGLFTQMACVLLARIPSPDELRQALLLATETEARPARGSGAWYEGTQLLVVPFDPDLNGYALLDMVEQPWPDDLDGIGAHSEAISAAWQIGHFGPGTWPGCLARAAQHCWAWKAAPTAAARHAAFLRVRLTYLLGVPGGIDQPYRGRSPISELLFLSHLVGALLTIRGALCAFQPAGEALRSAAFLEERLQLYRLGGPPPLDVWTNVRYLPVADAASWFLMDTVGMAQFDQPDIEAAFPMDKQERFVPAEIEAFLRNASLRLLREGEGAVLRAGGGTGEIAGPGGVPWRPQRLPGGLAAPPRSTLRYLPRLLARPPAALRG